MMQLSYLPVDMIFQLHNDGKEERENVQDSIRHETLPPISHPNQLHFPSYQGGNINNSGCEVQNGIVDMQGTLNGTTCSPGTTNKKQGRHHHPSSSSFVTSRVGVTTTLMPSLTTKENEIEHDTVLGPNNHHDPIVLSQDEESSNHDVLSSASLTSYDNHDINFERNSSLNVNNNTRMSYDPLQRDQDGEVYMINDEEDNTHMEESETDKTEKLVNLMKHAYAIAPPREMNNAGLSDIRKICNKYICSKVKFIKHEHLFGSTKVVQEKLKSFPSFWEPDVTKEKSMAYDIMSKCHGFAEMSVWNKVRLWKAVRAKVIQTIRAHRNTVQTKLQKSIVPALIELNRIGANDNLDVDNPPDSIKGMKEIRELALENRNHLSLMNLRDMKNPVMFRSFVDYCLMNTIGTIEWKGLKTEEVVSSVFTVHDEAFAILVMMNCWDEWEDRAKGKKIDRKNVKTLFTKSRDSDREQSVSSNDIRTQLRGIGGRGAVNNSNNKVTRGWNKEGMCMFNKLVKHIHTMRKDAYQVQMESDLKNSYKNESRDNYEQHSRKRKAEEIAILDSVEEEEVALDAYNFEEV